MSTCTAAVGVRRKIEFEYDREPDFSWLDQWDTPEKYRGNEVLENGKPVPFEEYARTWGNPDWYVALCMVVYELGPDDEDWRIVDTLGNIDMIESRNDWATGTFYRVGQLPAEYLRELAREAGIPE